MIPRVRFARTELSISRIALGTRSLAAEQGAAIIDAAIAGGINYIDLSQGTGDSEARKLVARGISARREGLILACSIPHHRRTPGQLRASVEEALADLRTDRIDVVNLHAGAYRPEQIRHILEDDLLDMLEKLKGQGKLRFIGFRVDEPDTARPLIASMRFDVMHVRHNLVEQSAANHVLLEAAETELGIAAIEPLGGKVLQQIASNLAPRWQEVQDVADTSLQFVLSDSRIHTAIIDMCSVDQVNRYAAIAEFFKPTVDFSKLER